MVFRFFLKKLRYKKLTELNMIFSSVLWGPIGVHSRAASLASRYDCSNPYGFRDMALFMIFHFFPKKNVI